MDLRQIISGIYIDALKALPNHSVFTSRKRIGEGFYSLSRSIDNDSIAGALLNYSTMRIPLDTLFSSEIGKKLPNLISEKLKEITKEPGVPSAFTYIIQRSKTIDYSDIISSAGEINSGELRKKLGLLDPREGQVEFFEKIYPILADCISQAYVETDTIFKEELAKHYKKIIELTKREKSEDILLKKMEEEVKKFLFDMHTRAIHL